MAISTNSNDKANNYNYGFGARVNATNIIVTVAAGVILQRKRSLRQKKAGSLSMYRCTIRFQSS